MRKLFSSHPRLCALALVALALPAAANGAPAPPKTYLLSLRGIALDRRTFIDGFSINTSSVGFRAVCHLPSGWTITAGKTASFDGVLKGKASHGVTFLDRTRLGELNGLALVTLAGPVRRTEIRSVSGTLPATFAGHASVGNYGSDRRRQVTLGYANVVLIPAMRCP